MMARIGVLLRRAIAYRVSPGWTVTLPGGAGG